MASITACFRGDERLGRSGVSSSSTVSIGTLTESTRPGLPSNVKAPSWSLPSVLASNTNSDPCFAFSSQRCLRFIAIAGCVDCRFGQQEKNSAPPFSFHASTCVIEPSTSRLSYQVVLVKQNNKDRFCIDFRNLNKSTTAPDSIAQIGTYLRNISYFEEALTEANAVLKAFRFPTG